MLHTVAMSKSPTNKAEKKTIATNKAAFRDYEISERYEAGVVLTGSEVKSLRDGRVNFGDAYALVRDEEVFLVALHISPYPYATHFNHEPLRERKLLLHRQEIHKLNVKTRERGFTLVPLTIYFSKGRVKVELGLAKGRKAHDKREVIRERDIRRDMEVARSRRR